MPFDEWALWWRWRSKNQFSLHVPCRYEYVYTNDGTVSFFNQIHHSQLRFGSIEARVHVEPEFVFRIRRIRKSSDRIAAAYIQHSFSPTVLCVALTAILLHLLNFNTLTLFTFTFHSICIDKPFHNDDENGNGNEYETLLNFCNKIVEYSPKWLRYTRTHRVVFTEQI